MSALDVPCPSCGVKQGTSCVRMSKGATKFYKIVTTYPHITRYEARIAELEGRKN